MFKGSLLDHQEGDEVSCEAAHRTSRKSNSKTVIRSSFAYSIFFRFGLEYRQHEYWQRRGYRRGRICYSSR
jgi:hypothetical protein